MLEVLHIMTGILKVRLDFDLRWTTRNYLFHFASDIVTKVAIIVSHVETIQGICEC